ncbi:MAG: hypothetical protein JSV10_01875 [Candidatus Zixiibacteriota bacterium]|nr:MAG: hypothetical protein JSV10_01875 [candidate division Zixibacteria bacterium]
MRRLVILLLYLFATGLIFIVFITHPGINGYSRAMFPDTVYGKAYKPFVYRTLLPTTVRMISQITPEHVKDRIRSAVEECNPQRKRIRMMKALGWETEYIYEYLVALALMFSCFLGFAFLLRHLVKLFYDFPPFVADFAPVGALLILPVFFKFYSYMCDPVTLLLFSLAIILITGRRILPFYVVFLLATLNRETSILLSGIFLVRQFKHIRTFSLAGHLLLQASIWIAVKTSLAVIFKNNQGAFIDFQLIDHNLALIADSVTSPTFLYHLLYLAAVIIVFWVLVRYRWSEKPISLRCSFLITAIPLALLVLLFGSIIELRVYHELFPFLFLLSLPTVVDIFKLGYDETGAG